MIERSYMVQPTLQSEWVERRGILIVIAFFLGGLGGGLYLMSLFFDFYAGIVAAFFIVVVCSICFLFHLGRPWKFWLAFLRPHSSWISRGMIAIIGFLLFTALQLAPSVSWLAWLPWTVNNSLLQALAIISAIVLVAYIGFALGVISAIPFWNSALMPVLFAVYSLLGGAGLTLGLLLSTGSTTVELGMVKAVTNWLLVIAVVVLGVYLWVSTHINPVVRYSVTQLIRGRISPYFMGGAVLLGLAFPLTVAGLGLMYRIPDALVLVAVACELAGAFFLRYSILKAGAYAPTI